MGLGEPGDAGSDEQALAKVPNVESVEVDYSSKTAIVRFDTGSPASVEQVIAAVEGAGYTARVTGDQGP